jgi:DNA/RNA endonuclease YhcR with UshA esterase domain
MKRLIVFLCLFAAPAWAETSFKPEEAAAHAGGIVTIEGVASVYTAQSGMVFLDMGGSGKSSTFSGVIFARDAGKFADIRAWNGKVLDITGTVQMYQGKPEIILTSPGQVAVK